MLAAFIDTRALAETVVAAVVSGVGITIVFSVAIYGAARFSQLGREGRTAAALFYGAVGVVSGAAFTAAIVAGIIVMTAK
ncbi:MAG: hypothetical protein ACR2G3_07960 [Solirubrobacterales bacterium]